MNISPLSRFILEDKTHITEFGSGVVWAQVLDCRYCMEVVRTEPYKGEFRVFDGYDDNKLVWKENVSVSYDAIFGVDAGDMEEFKDKGIDIVDNKLLKKV